MSESKSNLIVTSLLTLKGSNKKKHFYFCHVIKRHIKYHFNIDLYESFKSC